MTEIEIKAWVDDADAVRDCLDRLYEYRGESIKEDTHFICPQPSDPCLQSGRSALKKEFWNTFRLRKEDNRSTVTFKRKRVSEGMEINDEEEFEVSDPDAFQLFISRLGCRLRSQKRKRSIMYKGDDLSIELNHIARLGWFIEIEKMTDHDNQEEATRAALYAVLDRLQIPRKNIEPRFYSELLAGKESQPSLPSS